MVNNSDSLTEQDFLHLRDNYSEIGDVLMDIDLNHVSERSVYRTLEQSDETRAYNLSDVSRALDSIESLGYIKEVTKPSRKDYDISFFDENSYSELEEEIKRIEGLRCQYGFNSSDKPAPGVPRPAERSE